MNNHTSNRQLYYNPYNPNIQQIYPNPQQNYTIYNIPNQNIQQRHTLTHTNRYVLNPIMQNKFIIQPGQNITYINNVNNNIKIKNQNNPQFNIKSSFRALEDLNQTLNKNLSQSVFDLVNCFICLSPATEPMSCPKCNHFCCKKCFETFFKDQTTKKCPICKQDITFNELNKNSIIQDIENILYKQGNTNKVKELSQLLNEKKKEWEKQSDFLTAFLEKVYKYQQTLINYKNSYLLFLAGCQKVVEKTFQDFQKETEILANNLVSYNSATKNSIVKYNTIIQNNQNNLYNNKNVKQLINEILDMERKFFNKKNKEEVISFINKDIILEPKIIKRNLLYNNLKEGYQQITADDEDFRIGKFYGTCDIRQSSQKYNIISKFKIILEEGLHNIYISVNQKIKENREPKDIFTLKLIKNDNNVLEFERLLEIKDIDFKAQKERTLETEVLMFKTESDEYEDSLDNADPGEGEEADANPYAVMAV